MRAALGWRSRVSSSKWRGIPLGEIEANAGPRCVCLDEGPEAGGIVPDSRWLLLGLAGRGQRLAFMALGAFCLVLGLAGLVRRLLGGPEGGGGGAGDAVLLSDYGWPKCHIKHSHTRDLCVEVVGSLWPKGKNHRWGGTHVKLAHCERYRKKQLWYLQKDRGFIRWAYKPHICLDVAGGHTADGTRLQLWPCDSDLGTQMFLFPENGQGPIRWAAHPDKCIDGGHQARLHIKACPEHSEPHPDQLWLIPGASRVESHGLTRMHALDDAAACEEDQWPDRFGGKVCGECKVPVRYFKSYYKTCSSYCSAVGRWCVSAHKASSEDACGEVEQMECDVSTGEPHAVCQCGAQILRGQYGFLSEFWLPGAQLRERVRGMFDKFGIQEFQFYDAFEGFSRPPAFYKEEWECVMQRRLVKRDSLVAAVEEIRSLRGRSWFYLHAAAVDPDDSGLVSGHVTLPPLDVVRKIDSIYFEATANVRRQQRRRLGGAGNATDDSVDIEESYKELCGCELSDGPEEARAHLDPKARLLDVVVINAAWALRFVPRWAEFVSSLKFSGIHWDTFGKLGHWSGGPEPSDPFGTGHKQPDIPGFLRAALPILRKKGLEQTLSFVDGFGWDRELLGIGTNWLGDAGPVIAFPYWEVWRNPMPHTEYFKTIGSTRSFVMACYPGYSKYHCCERDERQNKGSYGIQPKDIGIVRWNHAIDHGGSYLFIGDGFHFAQGPFLPDSVELSAHDIVDIQTRVHLMKKISAPGLVAGADGFHSEFLYAVREDHRVYRQPLADLGKNASAVDDGWNVASEGDVQAVTLDGGTIYAVDTRGRIVKQSLSALTPHSEWHEVSPEDPDKLFRSIAIRGDTVYGVSHANNVLRHRLSRLQHREAWSVASFEQVTSVLIHGSTIYATDLGGRVVSQELESLGKHSKWKPIAEGPVTSIAIHGGDIYAVDHQSRVVMQALDSIGMHTEWNVVVSSGVLSVAVLSGVITF